MDPRGTCALRAFRTFKRLPPAAVKPKVSHLEPVDCRSVCNGSARRAQPVRYHLPRGNSRLVEASHTAATEQHEAPSRGAAPPRDRHHAASTRITEQRRAAASARAPRYDDTSVNKCAENAV